MVKNKLTFESNTYDGKRYTNDKARGDKGRDTLYMRK